MTTPALVDYITIDGDKIAVSLLPEDIQSSVRLLNKYRVETMELVTKIEDNKHLLSVIENSIVERSTEWAENVLNKSDKPD